MTDTLTKQEMRKDYVSCTLLRHRGNAEVMYKELMHYKQKDLPINREICLDSGQETGTEVSLRTPASLGKAV